MKALSHDPLNLIITGVGGQGNVLISQILGRAFMDKGYKVAVGETFGLSQRGGSVQSHVRVSTERIYGPLIPEGQAHAVLGLEPMETLRVLPLYGRPDIETLVNSRPIPPLNVNSGEARYPSEKELKQALDQLSARTWWVNATAVAQELGDAIMANIVLLGALTSTGIIPLESSDLQSAMKAIVPPGRLDNNLEAFSRGIRLIKAA